MKSSSDKPLFPEKCIPSYSSENSQLDGQSKAFYVDPVQAQNASAIASQKQAYLPRTHQPKHHAPSLPSTQPMLRGHVRATPYGNCIESSGYAQHNSIESQSWHEKRFTPKLQFPPEGFDHVYGPSVIQSIDGYNDQHERGKIDQQQQDEDDMLISAASEAYQSILHPHEEKKEAEPPSTSSTNQQEVDGNEYGSIRTPLDAPVGSLKEKWRLLPYFLQLRSLMRQHIDSFDHFVNVDMKKIVQVRFLSDTVISIGRVLFVLTAVIDSLVFFSCMSHNKYAVTISP